MLNFLRKSRLAVGLSLFAGFALLLVQCTPPEVGITSPDCSSSPFTLNSDINLSEMSENTLEMIRCSKNYFNFQTIEETQNHFFGENKFPKEVNEKVKAELDIYHNVGYAAYLNKLTEEGKMSANLRNTLETMGFELNTFMSGKIPTIEEFGQFYSQRDLSIKEGTLLCQSEKDLMVAINQIMDGTTKFFYKHNSELSSSNRDCDKGEFLLKLNCVLFTLNVLLLIYAFILAAFNLLVFLLPAGAVTFSFTINGVLVTSTAEGVAAGWTAILGVMTFQYWYNLCCKWDGEINCSPPTGMYYTTTGCNLYDFVIYGAGAYGATTWGLNENALPEAAITTTPVLRSVSGVDLTSISKIKGSTLCVNNEGSVTFPAEIGVTFANTVAGNLPSLSWGTLPSIHPPKDVDLDLSIATGNTLPVHEYGWAHGTHSTQFAITPSPNGGSPLNWKIKFLSSGPGGVCTIKFQVKNKCTGAIKFISKEFYL